MYWTKTKTSTSIPKIPKRINFASQNPSYVILSHLATQQGKELGVYFVSFFITSISSLLINQIRRDSSVELIRNAIHFSYIRSRYFKNSLSYRIQTNMSKCACGSYTVIRTYHGIEGRCTFWNWRLNRCNRTRKDQIGCERFQLA